MRKSIEQRRQQVGAVDLRTPISNLKIAISVEYHCSSMSHAKSSPVDDSVRPAWKLHYRSYLV